MITDRIEKNELDKILDAHHLWLETNGEKGKKADMENAYLQTLDLQGVNLRGANLKRANLERADLKNANLEGASLRRTNLRNANIRCANLQGADLRMADLQHANLSDANLQGANLLNTYTHGVDFSGADLRGAKVDYSSLPLWCGSFNMKIDRNIYTQLLYHLCKMIVDDKECEKHQRTSCGLANTADVRVRHHLDGIYFADMKYVDMGGAKITLEEGYPGHYTYTINGYPGHYTYTFNITWGTKDVEYKRQLND